MTRGYTSDGRRISSMTHARRGKDCEFCGKRVYGNGGQVSHARGHVRRGEAVELLKEYDTWPPTSSRLFLTPDDARVQAYIARDFHKVT
jgi:hypothetical protein